MTRNGLITVCETREAYLLLRLTMFRAIPYPPTTFTDTHCVPGMRAIAKATLPIAYLPLWMDNLLHFLSGQQRC